MRIFQRTFVIIIISALLDSWRTWRLEAVHSSCSGRIHPDGREPMRLIAKYLLINSLLWRHELHWEINYELVSLEQNNSNVWKELFKHLYSSYHIKDLCSAGVTWGSWISTLVRMESCYTINEPVGRSIPPALLPQKSSIPWIYQKGKNPERFEFPAMQQHTRTALSFEEQGMFNITTDWTRLKTRKSFGSISTTEIKEKKGKGVAMIIIMLYGFHRAFLCTFLLWMY